MICLSHANHPPSPATCRRRARPCQSQATCPPHARRFRAQATCPSRAKPCRGQATCPSRAKPCRNQVTCPSRAKPCRNQVTCPLQRHLRSPLPRRHLQGPAFRLRTPNERRPRRPHLAWLSIFPSAWTRQMAVPPLVWSYRRCRHWPPPLHRPHQRPSRRWRRSRLLRERSHRQSLHVQGEPRRRRFHAVAPCHCQRWQPPRNPRRPS
jgi:hypothetical protein